jgi:hypothetical protein
MNTHFEPPVLCLEVSISIKLKRVSCQKLCGSPVVISSNALKIKFDELTSLCNQYFIRYGNRAE